MRGDPAVPTGPNGDDPPRPAHRSRYGNQAPDWSNATRHATRHATRGWLEQLTGAEETAGRDALIGTWRLILAAGTDIVGRDRVDGDGVVFEVTGPPEVVHTPAGPHHIEAQLRTVEG